MVALPANQMAPPLMRNLVWLDGLKKVACCETHAACRHVSLRRIHEGGEGHVHQSGPCLTKICGGLLRKGETIERQLAEIDIEQASGIFSVSQHLAAFRRRIH